jgi:hypothetical protein
MHSFKDTTGQEWRIDLTLGKIMVIEGYDFSLALRKSEPTYLSFYPAQPDLFDLFENQRVIFSMVWCCIYDDAQTLGVPDELEFAKRLDGPCLRAAVMAMYAELPLFFCEMKTTLEALIERHSRLQTIADQRMGVFISQKANNAQLEQLVDREIDKLSSSVGELLGK